MKTVNISIEELNVLRGTLNEAIDLLNRLGVTGSVVIPGKHQKETKQQREKKYTAMLDKKIRSGKPDYLKKKP